jgi:hypothetical protein
VRLFAVERPFGFEGAARALGADWRLPPAGGTRQAANWKPPPVVIYKVEGADGTRLLESDFPLVLSDDFWLSERAARCLAPILDQYGELLPLHCEDRTLYAFNPLVITDALDPEHTWYWLGGTSSAQVETPAFVANKVQGRHMIRLPERSVSPVYVDDAFRRLVHACELRGLAFRLVWSDKKEVLARPSIFSSVEYVRAYIEATRQRRA